MPPSAIPMPMPFAMPEAPLFFILFHPFHLIMQPIKAAAAYARCLAFVFNIILSRQTGIISVRFFKP
jgi:hypothetical protein